MVQHASLPTTRSWDDPSCMLGVDEARATILAAFAPLDPIPVAPLEALGSILAENVLAACNVPPFTNAAMDGFAVRAADTASATPLTPVSLRVIGEAAAGSDTSLQVGPGTAMRIMTGAAVPVGADAVVRFEETDEFADTAAHRERRDGFIGIHSTPRRWVNIRPAGEDIADGDTVLFAGTRLRPAQVGLLAALGRTQVTVHRRPRVAILATGNEVVDPGGELGPCQLWNSNSTLVAALVRRCGGEPIVTGVARDAIGDLSAKLQAACDTDLIVTTGGVSVGDYDLVKDVLCAEGRIELWQVRIKPGKPLAFGWLGGRPLIGLPGNPVAAAVAFEQFCRPAILTMLGHRDPAIPTVLVRLLDRVENRGGRRHFARVQVDSSADGYVARLAGAQGAGILSSLARANGLLIIPEELPAAEPGMRLPVQMLDWEFVG